MGEWVAPDTPAEPAGPSTVAPAPTLPGAAGVGTSPGSPAAVPVPLQPLTISDLLDGGLRVFKQAPGLLAGIAAVFVVPTQVLLGVLTRHQVDDTSIGETFGDAFRATGPGDVESGLWSWEYLVGAVLNGVALAFATAATATLVAGWYVGRSWSFGELVRAALRRAWPLVAAWVLVHLVEATFAVGLLVPLLVPLTWFAVVSPVVACEGAGPVRAMKRSAALARRRFGAVLATCVLVGVVDAVLSSTLTAPGALYLEAGGPAGWAVNTANVAASALVTVPFVAGVCTLLYLDLRVRTEGLDIELAALRRFAPA